MLVEKSSQFILSFYVFTLLEHGVEDLIAVFPSFVEIKIQSCLSYPGTSLYTLQIRLCGCCTGNNVTVEMI
jgi:hypothetical protein